MQRGTHCSITVQPHSLVVRTDRDRPEGQMKIIPLESAADLHEVVASALKRFLPVGGRAVLIDNDDHPDFMEARQESGTTLLDPDLLGAQTGTDVELVSPRQALAAFVRYGNSQASSLTDHRFDSTRAFGLIVITDNGLSVSLSPSVVDAAGKAVPAQAGASSSLRLNRTGATVIELISHLTRELPEDMPGIAICVLSASERLHRTLAEYFGLRLRSTPHPVLLLRADPEAALSGGLILAQRQLTV